MAFLTHSFPVGTGVNVAGVGPDWADTNNIRISTDSRATVALTAGNSDLLRCTNFDLSSHLPVGATILGIQVELEWGLTVGNLGDLQLASIQLWDGSSTLGSSQSSSENVPGSEISEYWGEPNDLWGGSITTITPTVLRATGFGVQLAVSRTNNATVGVDHVRMSVWWKLGRGRNRGRER